VKFQDPWVLDGMEVEGSLQGAPKLHRKARSYLEKHFVCLLAGLGTLLPSVH
jgi:hypothetical protein